MKCIVGLGNPGQEYKLTRHNVGFLMLEFLREEIRAPDWGDSRFRWVTSEGMLWGEKILLLKPMTYMNLSGESVRAIVDYYKLDPKKDILVISDDIDMEFAKVRYRAKGSHGGQNGLRDIITRLSMDEFARIKIGIGRDERYTVSDWVLSRFSQSELTILEDEVFPKVSDMITSWLWGSIS